MSSEDGAWNARDQLGKWYYSESMVWSAIGMWMKFLFEYTVVCLPLLPIFATFGYFSRELTLSITPIWDSVFIYWASVSATVLGITWCFSLAGVSIEPADIEEESEQVSLDEATENQSG